MLYLTKLLPLLAGVFFCFGHPSFITENGLPLFPIIGCTLFLFSLNYKDHKKDLFNIFLFCSSINIVAFYWIPKTITTFGQIPLFFSYSIFLLFGFIVIPHTWTSYFLVTKLIKIKKVIQLKEKNPETFLLLTASLLTLVEYFTPTQFPVRLGQPWMNLKSTLGLTPLFGLPVYSFISYLFILSFYSYIKEKKIRKINFSLAIILITAGVFIRPWTYQEKSLNNEKGNFNIRIVQSNIGNYMKVQSELGQFNSLQEVYNRYFTQSIAKSKNKIDLIVWPETAFPEDLDTDYLEMAPSALPPIFKNIIAETNSEMLIGGYDKGKLKLSTNNLHTLYNSALHFSNTGQYLNVYHKHKLIPFGETLPLGPITPYIKDYVPGVSFFSKDEIHTVFETENGFNFVVPICYELLSPTHISDSLEVGTRKNKQPHFIINLTNDSWYGITAEPYQHLFLAKWRAVEFQTPIIRSTNSGITSIFDIDGEESSRLLLGEVKYLDHSLYLPNRTATIYQKWGILSFLSLTIIFFIIIFSYERFKKFSN